MILADLQVPPQIIGLSETKLNKKQGVNFSITLECYNFLHSDSDTMAGGFRIYINNSLSYQLRNDISATFGNSESLWIEVCICNKKCAIGVIYRHRNNDIQSFTHNLRETLHYLSNSKLPFLICGDININLLQQDTVVSVSNYVKTYNLYNCLELITKPNRITTTSSTLIDHIYTNLPATKLTSGILINDLSDHLPFFVTIKSKISRKWNLKSCNRHDYSNFNAENFVTESKKP